MILTTLKKTIPMIKILIKKITCIDLHLEKTCGLTNSHPKMLENVFIEISEIFVFWA